MMTDIPCAYEKNTHTGNIFDFIEAFDILGLESLKPVMEMGTGDTLMFGFTEWIISDISEDMITIECNHTNGYCPLQAKRDIENYGYVREE